MSDTFGHYWASLAYNGSLSQGGPRDVVSSPPHWPAYDDYSKPHMCMNVPPLVEYNLFEEFCDFWDTMGP